MPHHTEQEFPSDGMMLANGWASGKTFLFDLRQPTSPKLAATIGDVGGYSFPHSFVRLANGHVLATFQGKRGAYAPIGGLVEMDEKGTLVRAASAATADIAAQVTWPYSLVVDAAHDRVVTTSTAMSMPSWAKLPAGSLPVALTDTLTTRHIQIWRLSDLKLLQTILLPAGPAGPSAPANLFPAEPRLLADGSVYVNTFNCGLYHVTGLDGKGPVAAALVQVFPGVTAKEPACAVPAIVGHFWIQVDGTVPGLIALDIRDSAKPVEVARLKLGAAYMHPHWIAPDSASSRVVLTGHEMGYLLIVNVDPKTGALTIDQRFRDERTGAVGVNLSGRKWSFGTVQNAFVHGTLFGPR